MSPSGNDFNLASPYLKLAAEAAPWDAAVFGFPVAQIHTLDLIDRVAATSDYDAFQRWLDAERVRIVSCRLPHDRLRESMFLESHGFRFVEMVLHPRMDNIQALDLPEDNLVVASACKSDLPALEEIAERAFSHERYHVDPRLDRKPADLRYGRWVRNSLDHPTQRLLKITVAGRLLAFFLVESRDGSTYWHLTAVAPQWQGRGYGLRVWQAMLRHHQADACQQVTTTISARNVAVLNLYAKLNFRFTPPEMTFHWVREDG
jgi:RimJ/RimL family protein N-acetyltransferase